MQWTKQRKMMISGGLAVFSVALALAARKLSCSLAALAMGCSTLGDALLAGYPGCFAKVNNRQAKGGLVFLGAHILYIAALLVSSGKDISVLLPCFTLPFVLFFCVTVLHGALFYFRVCSPVPRFFFAAAFLYLLMAGVHAAAAVTVSGLSGGWYALNVAGALLFYLSDAILLARKYGAARGKHITAMIWITYVPAQFCLLIGFFLARQAPA